MSRILIVLMKSIILLPFLGLMGCDPDLEKSDFNAYFYFPDDREEYLGQVTGLSSCQSAAGARAKELNMIDSDWSYICCRITSSSSCASKHR
jgi:hypothetical protein